MQKRLVVLISNAGTGTNLQAIIDAINHKTLSADIVGVISDKSDALGLMRAEENEIPTFLCESKEDLLPLLVNLAPDYICLTGWKQFIEPKVMQAYHHKILNIHPGLIPDDINGTASNPDGTPGLWNKGKFTDKALQSFLDEKATYAGSSVHFLTDVFDFGPVLGRCYEQILPGDTAPSLYKRLKIKENELLVDVLKKLCN